MLLLQEKIKIYFHFDERDKYDFINTYENKTKCSYYDVEDNTFYFKKNKEKDDNDKDNSLIIGLLILLTLIFCLIGIFYFFKNKSENREIIQEELVSN